MASRAEQKAQARARRIEAEQAERRAARRRASMMRLGLVLALAVVVVIVAVVVSSRNTPTTSSGPTPGDGAAATAQFKGIPQSGIHLGRASAPTLIEFVDLQCPYCREFNDATVPSVIKRFVRTGKVRYELRVRSFLGPDSVRAAGAAAEAAKENKLYPFEDLFYHRQKTENTGYVTDDFIRSVASAVGVNPSKAVAAANDAKSQPLVAQAENKASALGSNGTPDFYLRLKSGRLVPVTHNVLPPDAFAQALDKALSQKT